MKAKTTERLIFEAEKSTLDEAALVFRRVWEFLLHEYKVTSQRENQYGNILWKRSFLYGALNILQARLLEEPQQPKWTTGRFAGSETQSPPPVCKAEMVVVTERRLQSSSFKLTPIFGDDYLWSTENHTVEFAEYHPFRDHVYPGDFLLKHAFRKGQDAGRKAPLN